ncbi:MAG TPA: hypothetical protein VN867_02440 [Candidatus Binataceae bacterium]|nr:hypothetical protein [Candidatus Binataceae bacterium]
MILIDMRGFLLHGGDFGDYCEIAYGAQAFQPHQFPLLHWVSGRPIRGLFELDNGRAAARLIQERIHVLSFVCERDFCEGEIGKIAFNVPNYNLFSNTEAAGEALRSHPFAKKVAAA